MNEDKLSDYVFDPDNLRQAIDKGLRKDMNKKDLVEMSDPQYLMRLHRLIRTGRYMVGIPWTAEIPKNEYGYVADPDTGRERWQMKMRTVYILPPKERILLGLCNDALFHLCADMVHPACTSYRKGMSTGRSVQRVVSSLSEAMRNGWGAYKMDLSKYFDSVPIGFIDEAFDAIERRIGPSALLRSIRLFYHTDAYYDSKRKRYVRQYQSLKQGVAVASFLADAILYDMDRRVSELDVLYIRYSDDILCIGREADRGMEIIREELSRRGMELNARKTETLTADRFFKFLGFSLRGSTISLSESRIRKFAREVAEVAVVRTRSIGSREARLRAAVRGVMDYLYNPRGQYSWATAVLPVVNCEADLQTLNAYVLDCLRAAMCRREIGVNEIGGLGFVPRGREGCIERGRRRFKTGSDRIPGYLSLVKAKRAMAYGVFDTLLRDSMRQGGRNKSEPHGEALPAADDAMERLDELYLDYKYSSPSQKSDRTSHLAMFSAAPYEELTDDDIRFGQPREQSRRTLEDFFRGSVRSGSLRWDTDVMGEGFFYRSPSGMVILRDWVEPSAGTS